MRGSVSVRRGWGEVCGTKVMSSARPVLDTNVAVASFFSSFTLSPPYLAPPP